MFKTLASKAAAELDHELMSTGAFSIDQLMELAGLAVAQAIYKQYPPSTHNKLLVLVGPGNNGGDGLVASRHLKIWGYEPTIYYPKRPKNDLYQRLVTQLNDLSVKQVNEWSQINPTDSSVIVDALFGFSFKPPVREPFVQVLSDLSATDVPIVSVDIPSGWDVDQGPSGVKSIIPQMLISLTAPKPCAQKLQSGTVHYVGGRFINQKVAKKYGLEDIISKYNGNDMVYKI